MNETQIKSLKLIDELFENMDKDEFLKWYRENETFIGPTIDEFTLSIGSQQNTESYGMNDMKETNFYEVQIHSQGDWWAHIDDFFVLENAQQLKKELMEQAPDEKFRIMYIETRRCETLVE